MSESSDAISAPSPITQPGPPGYPQSSFYAPYGYPYPMMPGPLPELPKGMSIAGMVLGIVGLCTALFYIGGAIGIVGLIFSIIALRNAGRGLAGGKGMAIAGLVTSIVAIIVNAIEIIVIVWFLNTVSNCAQYDTQPDPSTGITQVHQCIDSNFFGS